MGSHYIKIVAALFFCYIFITSFLTLPLSCDKMEKDIRERNNWK